MVIGTGYHRNSSTWEPTIAGRSLQWWREYLADTKLDHWYALPTEGSRALKRAFGMLRQEGWFLHFDRVEGVDAFVINTRRNWGYRMRRGEFVDWKSGEKK